LLLSVVAALGVGRRTAFVTLVPHRPAAV